MTWAPEPDFDLAPTVDALPDLPRYFPLASGRYEVRPGFMPLTESVFTGDRTLGCYTKSKKILLAQREPHCYREQNLAAVVRLAVSQWLARRLAEEHPQRFGVRDGALINLVSGQSFGVTEPSFLRRAGQEVAEDLAVIQIEGDHHWLSLLHVCFPSGWRVADKIGRTFAAIHAPVAGMTPLNRKEHQIVRAMVTKPPMVRFTWGLTGDRHLNHDPDFYQPILPPPHYYLRVERQVIWGLPDVQAAVFTIRTYLRDCLGLNPQEQLLLYRAIATMDTPSCAYKSIDRQHVLQWLQQNADVSIPLSPP
ncbi:MAG: DUF3445 domain-containing protein [Oscillatoriales cyanobacterium SM2_2_1]|nr:DUF3445 domain-containing protein [Oscillatoriales cyanobacterium SM2_2_1]